MQDDSVNAVTPQAPVQGGSFQVPASSPVANVARDGYEMALFVLGIVAIISLLFNIGPLLQVSAGLFLVIAVATILRSLHGSSTNSASPTTSTSSVNNSAKAGEPLVQQVSYGSKQHLSSVKRWSPLRILGAVVILILIAPMLFFLFVMAFLMIILFTGGGKGS